MLTDSFPSVMLAHTPTPLEYLANLSKTLQGPKIWVKRDDCTGLAMGGNKARQLEFYIGDAVAKGADILLTTGAVQSNHVRMTVAAARKLGLEVEVQLEQRVANHQDAYHESGNYFLIKMMGAKIHHYPVGEDESGADRALHERADAIAAQGGKPYVIPLASGHVPYGALGYVKCAEELLLQIEQRTLNVGGVVVASGSASTHAGLLVGLRALDSAIPVYGICVRRGQAAQAERVLQKAHQVSEMLDRPGVVVQDDIRVDDRSLQPGYGQLNEQLLTAMQLSARCEGLLLDPVYSGKSMAGLMAMVRDGSFHNDQCVIFIHTGGTPALFAYPEVLQQQPFRADEL